MIFRAFTTLFLLFFCLSTSYAQPKREFRGVWVANVTNVDWPSNKNLTPEQQRLELISLLDLHQKQGLNAIFLQVRNTCDAVYQSNIEPWSEWLMGQQGVSPGYDPLALAVQECRKRGMEIHAWINPFRAVLDVSKSSVSPNHISKTRPDWILSYGNLRILDPGNPEVRSYVTKIVLDIARRYDIDGIHFDDYFYPYPQTGLNLADDASFTKYNRGFSNKADWRRDNVDLLVKTVSDSIKNLKPWLKFGISPFGIWQNRNSSSLGSNTKGFESYSGIYADSRKWIEHNWIDYVVPQIYWSIDNATADYSVLVPWWNNNTYGRHLYVGHGLYKVNNDLDANWRSRFQILKQIELARSQNNVKGDAFFSSKTLRNNPLGISSLISSSYNHPALIPTMPWKDNTPPPTPTELTATQVTGNRMLLSWKASLKTNNEFDRIRSFVIYRVENNRMDLSNSASIRAIVPVLSANQSLSFEDIDLAPNKTYTYAITALDRFQNESNAATTSQGVVQMATPEVAAVVETKAIVETKPERQVSVPVVQASTVQDVPTEAGGLQVFPNPFNQQVSIRFNLENAAEVQLFVFDSKGSKVGVLIDGEKKDAGQHSVIFNGEFLSGGTYYARFMTKGAVKTAKILLVK